MNKANNLKIGWGEKEIMPNGGKVYIAGSVPFRATSKVHDTIRATAMAIVSDTKRLIWVSCDFCHPSKQVEDRVIELLIKRIDGFSADELIISGTHATACFYISDNEILNCGHLLSEAENLIPLSQAREQFCLGICDAVVEAIKNAEYQSIEYASFDVESGFCRRPVYKDGSAVMYGDVRRDDFLKMEYPDRHQTDAFYFYERGTKKLRAILACAPCPAQADESSEYITADYWGYVRELTKEKYGRETKLFALCKSAGELSPHRLFAEDVSGEWGRARAEELGGAFARALLDGETKENLPIEICQECFDFKTEDFDFPARHISEDDYIRAKNYMQCKENYNDEGKAIDWIAESNARHKVKFFENNITSYKAKFSVIKLGEIVFFTAPTELYTYYAESVISSYPDCKIVDIQLTHDSIGYLPTKEAISHGGYSTHHFSALCDEIGGMAYVCQVKNIIDDIT